MHYYLAQWTGLGTDASPFTPDLDAAVWTCIDLRPNSSVASGFCVVATQDPATRVPSSATYLGDGSFAQIPNNLRNRLRNVLGLSVLTGLTVPEIVGELLTVRAGSLGIKPLKPIRKQTSFGLVDHYEIHLGTKLREWDEAVTP